MLIFSARKSYGPITYTCRVDTITRRFDPDWAPPFELTADQLDRLIGDASARWMSAGVCGECRAPVVLYRGDLLCSDGCNHWWHVSPAMEVNANQHPPICASCFAPLAGPRCGSCGKVEE